MRKGIPFDEILRHVLNESGDKVPSFNYNLIQDMNIANAEVNIADVDADFGWVWFQFAAKSDIETCLLDSGLGLLNDDELGKANKPVFYSFFLYVPYITEYKSRNFG